MKKRCILVFSVILILFVLVGCKEDQTIVGKWEDEEGYIIQFLDNGTFVENTFNCPMVFEFDNGELMFGWVDGYLRKTTVTYVDSDNISFQINGKLRNFHKTNKDIGTPWSEDYLSRQKIYTGKLNLIGNMGVSSEIILYNNNTFSLNGKGDDEVSVSGHYADRGNSDCMILYTAESGDSVKYEKFIESPSGDYVSTMQLSGKLTNVEEDWSSPITWRGYTAEGTVYNESNGISYSFEKDNTVRKICSDSISLLYAYFIDKDGLITLSSLDNYLDTDYLWVDNRTGDVFRMVYKRDSWSSYMYAVAVSDKQTVITNSIPGKGASYILDSDLIVRSDLGVLDLPGEQEVIFDELYQMADRSEEAVTLRDYLTVEERKATLEYELLTKEEREEQLRKEKEEFLAEMGVLAEQKRIADERAEAEMRANLEAEGFVYDAESDTWYYPGNVFIDDHVPTDPWDVPPIGGSTKNPIKVGDSTQFSGGSSSGDSSGSIGTSHANIPFVDTSKGYIKFLCNCDDCYNSESGLPKGSSNVALVDSTIFIPGTVVTFGDNSTDYQFTFVDSKGLAKGSSIYVYSTDHDWVNQQSDGSYSINIVEN